MPNLRRLAVCLHSHYAVNISKYAILCRFDLVDLCDQLNSHGNQSPHFFSSLSELSWLNRRVTERGCYSKGKVFEITVL